MRFSPSFVGKDLNKELTNGKTFAVWTSTGPIGLKKYRWGKEKS
jgi:hypothetical protein